MGSRLTYILILFVLFLNTKGQNTVSSSTIQPTIVVIPFTTTGQDALNLYESKFEYRAIISEINNAINSRGSFMPQDLQEIISRIKENSVINELNDVSIDPVSRLLNNVTADILIKAEIFIFSENSLNSVQITLKAIDKASGKTIFASPLLTSPGFKTSDYAYLAKRVLAEGDAIGSFCNGMSNAFQSIALNGRSIQIIFESTSNSVLTFDDEDKELNTVGDLIIDWIKKTSYKGYFKIRTQTPKQIYFEEVRIPFKNTDGTNYDINLYARELRKSMAELYVKVKGGDRPKIPTPLISNGVIRFYLL